MTRCKTIILSDTPSERDEFGIYLPVVDAFVDMITNDVGGKAIGLSGSWGSGKSTVMRMLALRLAEDPICVWHFDAWAHEGDPLRRTFLERLIDRLNERGWVDKEHWTKKRGELAKRIKTTQSKSTPLLTKAGAFAAALALMVPIGIAMVGEGIREAGAFHLASEFNFFLTAGPIVALGPLLALVVAFSRGARRASVED